MFLVLIYYIHDLPKQKLMQRKMQFVAYEMAAILQNIAKQKSTPITKEDLIKATKLAYLSHFVGPSMWPDSSGKLPYGYGLHTWTYYIVGTGENQAQIKWCRTTWTWASTSYMDSDVYYKQHQTSSVKYSATSTNATSIYPNLRISKGEVKILLECALAYSTRSSSRETFNFLLLSPISRSQNKGTWFHSVAIFTPVAGAFSGKVPE